MKTKITDDFLGKLAKLKVGFASGLIGIIEKNTSGVGVSPYIHATKSGIKTGVIFQEDIEIVEIN
jgi:hypothetical protein